MSLTESEVNENGENRVQNWYTLRSPTASFSHWSPVGVCKEKRSVILTNLRRRFSLDNVSLSPDILLPSLIRKNP